MYSDVATCIVMLLHVERCCYMYSGVATCLVVLLHV